MSRSDYSDDCTEWDLIRWRGAVASAIRGKRGQALLREMLAVLDAMPEKRLIAKELVTADGEVCALGAVGRARNMPSLKDIDPEDSASIAVAFGIADALAREIMFKNDDPWLRRTPEGRWVHMRAWVAENIKESA